MRCVTTLGPLKLSFLERCHISRGYILLLCTQVECMQPPWEGSSCQSDYTNSRSSLRIFFFPEQIYANCFQIMPEKYSTCMVSYSAFASLVATVKLAGQVPLLAKEVPLELGEKQLWYDNHNQILS